MINLFGIIFVITFVLIYSGLIFIVCLFCCGGGGSDTDKIYHDCFDYIMDEEYRRYETKGYGNSGD